MNLLIQSVRFLDLLQREQHSGIVRRPAFKNERKPGLGSWHLGSNSDATGKTTLGKLLKKVYAP